MADIPEALLGDRIPFEDHIADDVVLMKGNGVMAMFAVAGVFPDTADEVDIATWKGAAILNSVVAKARAATTAGASTIKNTFFISLVNDV